MPTKTREYYLTTSSSRDFAWFFFKPASPQHSRSKPEPSPPNRATRCAKRPTVTEEEPGLALMAPADVKARAQARSKPTKAKKPNPKKTAPKNAGPWSDWYVSDDRNYFWRARKAQNETWDYQLTPGYQEPAPTQDITPATSGGELGRPLSPIPESLPGCLSSSPSLPRDPTSPKSSWPTIITTSTGYPTEDLSASSSRTLFTLPREAEDGNYPQTALVPFVVTTNSSRTKNKDTKRTSINSKRQVGPVMRLLQEGRSRKSRVRTEATQSTANNTAAMTTGTQQGGDHKTYGNIGNGGVTVIKNRTASAFARKLHAKVKSEKELKVDPKKRVRAWLKGVEVDLAPMPLDAQGFPIYR